MSSWPSGTRSALSFSFDFDAEEVWIADDTANAERPGVLSQGRYGAKVGVPKVLELLRSFEVRSTFFIPGRVAERYPNRVKEILAAGHEVGHHGYTHRSPASLGADEEAEELTRGLDVLRELGADVRGYRSPSWELSTRTLDLLGRHGFAYSSNLMDDVRPYRHDGGLVEVPVSWSLDDAPHMWFGESSWEKTIVPNDHIRRLWTDEFEGIDEMGGACVFAMHPQFIGRPGRLSLLADMLELSRRADVWTGTVGEIAEVTA
ncbi:MAG: peptidoglycan-N-acetylglucosamine deacetylase [Actinomycetota bacterium]|jgi:peptidoglycan/xylan/chitin deacetylase (PgdA/CDA1 family)|nr:peptidoglycan-N-acetylglucosamine deacetylase [Actinomycetota bacterium]